MTRPHRAALLAALTLLPLLLDSRPVAAQEQRFGLIPKSGSALSLARHDLRLTVDHPVVQTVVTQEFENHSPRDLEATFFYPVPRGAVVTGLALWVGGERREARMLERQKAREIYQGIVNEKRDPALLERLHGNLFRIRIFPVLARSRTRVELRFVQPVTLLGEGRYRVTVPKPPGPTVHALRLGLALRPGFALAEARLSGFDGRLRPGETEGELLLPMGAATHSFARDIVLDYRARTPAAAPRVATLAAAQRSSGSRLFVAEVPLRRRKTGAGRRVALLLDTSASMAARLGRARELCLGLVDALADRDELALIPFALLPKEPLALAPLSDAHRAAVRGRLEGLEARLGSAFLPAVRRALAQGVNELVLVSDGGSPQHRAELQRLLRLLFDRPGVSFSVVALPGAKNAEVLGDLAAISGGSYHALRPADRPSEVAAALLRGAGPRQGVSLGGEEASAAEVALLSSGPDALLLTGRGQADASLSLRHQPSGQRLDLPLSGGGEEVAGVGGLYAEAAIQRRMRQIKLWGESEDLRREVVALSQQHNVVSEYTALLATETDSDYGRPTSGRTWQRRAAPDHDLPATQFSSTPEPHEWALIILVLTTLLWARRRWTVPPTLREP